MIKGFVCGVFDLFHAGHAMMLKDCKNQCDHLTVALNKADNLSPEKNKPIYSIEERVFIIESIKYVDNVLIYSNEDELTWILESLEFNVRFLGDDYKTKSITSRDLLTNIIYINRDHGISSSSVRNRILNENK